MSDASINVRHDTPRKSGAGAALFTLSGLAAAFGAASCCALPILLATFGIGTAWLVGIAVMAAPYRTLLLVLGAVALAGGAVLLWKQQRAAAVCAPDRTCMTASARILTLVGLITGAALLWAGYTYV